ncbi:voltage-gated purine nucleotide uniporter SLC17A9 isoform X11 [Cavia porcellus]|uniref:voltage-gated purine nucleotide uniporter SLC17A9 isoform X11 n=1 Tax=Cavia porcellus TaxID=10141 RepID=UPI000661DB75|nr:solute carrier family 17 member 9 isoform X9 [Cavia porcellus]
MQPSTDQAHRDAAEDAQWSRPECQVWTGTLLLGTCLLYCVRVSMPVCTVAMSQDFGWNKKEAGVVLSSFFWGYCLTQVVGGHLGDRRVLPGPDQPAVTACARERAGLHLQHCGGRLSVWDAADRRRGLLAPGLGRLAERLLLLGRPHLALDRSLALGVLMQGLPLARPSKVPWRQLFRKPSVWAVICSQLSSACSFFILLSWLPTFFKETFPHSKGWVFNVVPWLAAIPASLFGGFLSDHLISRGPAHPRQETPILSLKPGPCPASSPPAPVAVQVAAFLGTLSGANGNHPGSVSLLRLQSHHCAEVHAALSPTVNGPWPVKLLRTVSGSHVQLSQGYGLRISFHWPPDLQPQVKALAPCTCVAGCPRLWWTTAQGPLSGPVSSHSAQPIWVSSWCNPALHTKSSQGRAGAGC